MAREAGQQDIGKDVHNFDSLGGDESKTSHHEQGTKALEFIVRLQRTLVL